MKTVLFGEHEYTGNADALSAARVVMAIRVLVLHRNTRFHQGPTSEFCSLGQEVSQKETNSAYLSTPCAIANLRPC
jgi:GDP-D-mannose dehydratase